MFFIPEFTAAENINLRILSLFFQRWIDGCRSKYDFQALHETTKIKPGAEESLLWIFAALICIDQGYLICYGCRSQWQTCYKGLLETAARHGPTSQWPRKTFYVKTPIRNRSHFSYFY